MPQFLASFTPEDLSTWAAALMGVVGVLTVGLLKAAPAWAEIRRHLGLREDESLHAMVKETRDMVRDHETRLQSLEAEITQEDRPSKPLILVGRGAK